ncbi:hypothetical protein [Helicobacter bilis]|uniref:hypothetical protein n=1 Tax=Helicobacter bilis TaxID=37372 RepID=UPI001F2D324D|nr:hypothetical protein [Helicobacter bilis]
MPKTLISNSYQNVLSNANKPDLLKSYDMQQTTVNALKAIGEAPTSDYTDEWKKVQIPDYNTDFDTTILEIYAAKSVIAINEVIGFHIVTSIELVEVEWDFGDGKVSNQMLRVAKRIIYSNHSVKKAHIM